MSQDASWVMEVRKAYEEGASDVEVCKIVGVTQATFKKYYDSNESFQKLVDLGRTLSSAWWHSQGRKNLTNRAFNTSLWSFNMKNRFGWAEKTEAATNAHFDSLSDDQLNRQYEALKKKLLKSSAKSEAELLEATSGKARH